MTAKYTTENLCHLSPLPSHALLLWIISNFPHFRSVAAGLGCPASPAHSMVRCLREAELGELLNVSQTLQSRYVQLFLPPKENKYLLSTLTTFPFTWSRCEGHRQPASPVSVAFVCCGPNNGNTENNLLLPHIYFYILIPSDWACDEILICSKPNGKSFAKSILWKIAFANRYF